MSDLIRWPFPLPVQFLDVLGYGRTVAAFESPAVRAHLAELLRQQGIEATQAAPTGPRRYVLLHWEPAGDELAWSDGAHSGAGQLDHWLFLDLVHRPQVHAWLVEHQIDLGSSDAEATHALVVDRHTGGAHVAPIALAHRIVRAQSLAQEAQS